LYTQRQQSAKGWSAGTLPDGWVIKNSSGKRTLIDLVMLLCHGDTGLMVSIVLTLLFHQPPSA
jgi:hypothetical protein